MFIITPTRIFFQFTNSPEQFSNWYLQRGSRLNRITQFTRERFLKQAIANPDRNKSADSNLKDNYFLHFYQYRNIFVIENDWKMHAEYNKQNNVFIATDRFMFVY